MRAPLAKFAWLSMRVTVGAYSSSITVGAEAVWGCATCAGSAGHSADQGEALFLKPVLPTFPVHTNTTLSGGHAHAWRWLLPVEMQEFRAEGLDLRAANTLCFTDLSAIRTTVRMTCSLEAIFEAGSCVTLVDFAWSDTCRWNGWAHNSRLIRNYGRSSVDRSGGFIGIGTP